MSTNCRYNYIILDLGGVILNLDYNQTVNSFKNVIKDLDESTFFGKEHQLPFFSDYEIGRTNTAEFVQEFNKYYKTAFSSKEFQMHWNAMIFDVPLSRIELLKEIRRRGKKVFLLSNINELHANAVEESFGRHKLADSFESLFDEIYYSHLIGKRKPNLDIFDFVLKSNSIPKDQALFVDDSLHHVLGARSFGIEAIHLTKDKELNEVKELML